MTEVLLPPPFFLMIKQEEKEEIKKRGKQKENTQSVSQAANQKRAETEYTEIKNIELVGDFEKENNVQ